MIPIVEPWITSEEIKEVMEVLKSTWITEGQKTEQLEEMLKDYTGAKHAILVFNGTVALYIVLKALNIGTGDEVIVPDLTFIATANAVIMAGARPVLVDVDDTYFNIDPDKIEEEITDKTKAIIPVHLYGLSANMDKILKIAKKYNIYVIEDAAQGIGVKYKGKHVGHLGHAGIISFYGNKTITMGEGGVILTDDDIIAEQCIKLKNHGRTKTGTFVHEDIGFNFRTSDLLAAIGIGQMKKLDIIIKRKNDIHNWYMEFLEDIERVSFTKVPKYCTPVFWLTNIMLDDPGKLSEFLKKHGIVSRRFFYPLHKQPCYRKDRELVKNIDNKFPNSEFAYNSCLSLPSSVTLFKEKVEQICTIIKRYYS